MSDGRMAAVCGRACRPGKIQNGSGITEPVSPGSPVDGHHGGLRKEVELRGAGPGVGAHGTADDQIARFELRQHEVFRDHVDAVAGGAGEHRRKFLLAFLQRLHRILGVVEELAAVRAVQAVVEVIPPVSLALRAAHHRGHADGRRARR